MTVAKKYALGKCAEQQRWKVGLQGRNRLSIRTEPKTNTKMSENNKNLRKKHKILIHTKKHGDMASKKEEVGATRGAGRT